MVSSSQLRHNVALGARIHTVGSISKGEGYSQSSRNFVIVAVDIGIEKICYILERKEDGKVFGSFPERVENCVYFSIVGEHSERKETELDARLAVLFDEPYDAGRSINAKIGNYLMKTLGVHSIHNGEFASYNST